MNEAYRETVRLLLDVAPATFQSPHFAMKGGTAINLFVLDMPRMSIDIDVAYTRFDLPRAEALQDIAETLARVGRDLKGQALAVRLVPAGKDPDSKIEITRGNIQVKIEVNTMLRGTVLPTERRELAPAAQARFLKAADVPILAPAELYGGKLVAALDRQHPRDLFDVSLLFGSSGLTSEIRQCFVIYLAAHNRPPHEVLAPKLKDIRATYQNELQGMTERALTLDDLLAARDRLVAELPAALSKAQRTFLLSLIQGEPDWAASGVAHAERLPALQWKLQNIRKLRETNQQKYQANVEALENCLSLLGR
jgi:hypothetical protein